MQLIGRRSSLMSLFIAAEAMTFGAPGASAAPTPEADPAPIVKLPDSDAGTPGLEPILAERATNWWVPTQSTKWQIQLSGTPINQNIDADAIEIDLFDTPTSVIKSLKAKGKKVIAYTSGGTFEDWRSDANKFPSSVKGEPLDEWEGERWLDVRNINVLKPIMQKRAELAKSKGFDGIDWDNMDGYTQDSGYSISAAQQLKYNRMLADLTHGLGLTVALKNDLDQVKALEPWFDFAVNEQCGFYKECDMLKPFLDKGKAVLGIEYPGYYGDKRNTAQMQASTDKRIYTLVKKLDLGAPGTILWGGKSVLTSTSSSKTKSSRFANRRAPARKFTKIPQNSE